MSNAANTPLTWCPFTELVLTHRKAAITKGELQAILEELAPGNGFGDPDERRNAGRAKGDETGER